MQEHCAPQIVNTSEESNDTGSNDEEEKLNKLIRQVTNRIDEVDDTLLAAEEAKDQVSNPPPSFPPSIHSLLYKNQKISTDARFCKYFTALKCLSKRSAMSTVSEG